MTFLTVPRWPYGSVLVAAVLTLGVFLLLPYLEMLSHASRSHLSMTAVEIVAPPAVAPPLPPQVRREPRRSARSEAQPRLKQPSRLIPISAALNLDLAVGEVGGDFDLSFPLASGGLLSDVGAMVFEVSDLDDPPRLLVGADPVYPPRARARQQEGAVTLEFVVRENGEIADIGVASSHPGEIFVDAALDAVRRWRFSPGTLRGEPVSVRVRQTIEFRLE